MSYILDALKKAELERERGEIPTDHMRAPPSLPIHSGRFARLTWLGMLCGLLTAIIAVVWFGWFRTAPPQPGMVGNSTQGFVRAAEHAPERLNPATQKMTNESTSLPVGMIQHSDNPVKNGPARAGSSNATAASERPMTAAPSLVVPTSTSASPAVASANTRTIALAADPLEEQTVGALQDLPDNIQRELPVVVVSGFIYAQKATDRSILIGKRLLREGDQIGPDLTLEKITSSGAILNFKGYRYRVAF